MNGAQLESEPKDAHSREPFVCLGIPLRLIGGYSPSETTACQKLQLTEAPAPNMGVDPSRKTSRLPPKGWSAARFVHKLAQFVENVWARGAPPL